MKAWGRSLLVAMLALALVGYGKRAEARGRGIRWSEVQLPAGTDSERHEATLRQALLQAVRKTDFGKGSPLSAKVEVTELRWEHKKDVARLHCTLIGRLEGGAPARSRIAFGGDPKNPEALEREVFSAVSTGLVSRLAQMARSIPSHKSTAAKIPKVAKSTTSAGKETGAAKKQPPVRPQTVQRRRPR